jgi:hypothetical protein
MEFIITEVERAVGRLKRVSDLITVAYPTNVLMGL